MMPINNVKLRKFTEGRIVNQRNKINIPRGDETAGNLQAAS